MQRLMTHTCTSVSCPPAGDWRGRCRHQQGRCGDRSAGAQAKHRWPSCTNPPDTKPCSHVSGVDMACRPLTQSHPRLASSHRCGTPRSASSTAIWQRTRTRARRATTTTGACACLHVLNCSPGCALRVPACSPARARMHPPMQLLSAPPYTRSIYTPHLVFTHTHAQTLYALPRDIIKGIRMEPPSSIRPCTHSIHAPRLVQILTRTLHAHVLHAGTLSRASAWTRTKWTSSLRTTMSSGWAT